MAVLRDPALNYYSIKDLERLSGIKAHTIRIWEQRYGIIKPRRTNTNIRYYNDDDLKRILNISLLNRNHYKISKIAKMADEDLKREVMSISEREPAVLNQINALTICMIELDEERFEKVLSTNILRYGFEKTMVNIIFPFLDQVGVMWMTGVINPAQEHFMSNMIRQKLIVAIDGQIPSNQPGVESYMLYCPEGEFHEIGLLFMNYMLRTRKKKVIYLGASVPFNDLSIIYEVHKPDYLLAYCTISPSGEELKEYTYLLGRNFPKAKILLCGPQYNYNQFSLPLNATVLKDLPDMFSHLGETALRQAS